MQIFINGFGLALILLVPYLDSYISFKTGWLISASVIGYYVFQKIQSRRRKEVRILYGGSKTALFAASVFALLTIHNLGSRYGLLGFRQSVTDTLPEVFLFSAIVLIMYHAGGVVNPKKWLTLVVGIGIYCAVNLAAYLLGVRASNEIELEAGTFAMGTSIEKRMLAPFSSGVNSFGTICLLALGISLILLLTSRSQSTLVEKVLCILVIGVSSVCNYFVQIRSSLFVIPLIAGYVWISSGSASEINTRIRGKWILVVTAMVVFLLPISNCNLFLANILEDYMPDLLFSIGRSSGDFSHLGGRAYLWDYAWEQLVQGQIGMSGQGIESRDSSAVLNLSIGSEYNVRTSYHNGSMEMLVSYGLVGYFMLMLLFSLVVKYSSLNERNQTSFNEKWNGQISIGVIILCVSLTILEAFTNSAIFWSTIVAATLNPIVENSVNKYKASSK